MLEKKKSKPARNLPKKQKDKIGRLSMANLNFTLLDFQLLPLFCLKKYIKVKCLLWGTFFAKKDWKKANYPYVQ